MRMYPQQNHNTNDIPYWAIFFVLSYCETSVSSNTEVTEYLEQPELLIVIFY